MRAWERMMDPRHDHDGEGMRGMMTTGDAAGRTNQGSEQKATLPEWLRVKTVLELAAAQASTAPSDFESEE